MFQLLEIAHRPLPKCPKIRQVDVKKKVIFLFPLSPPIQALKDKWQKEFPDAGNFFEVDDVGEFKQLIGVVGESITLCGDVRKFMRAYKETARFFRKGNCKHLIATPKSVPPPTLDKLDKLGVRDIIHGNITERQVEYKIEMLTANLPDDEAEMFTEVESVDASSADTSTALRMESDFIDTTSRQSIKKGFSLDDINPAEQKVKAHQDIGAESGSMRDRTGEELKLGDFEQGSSSKTGHSGLDLMGVSGGDSNSGSSTQINSFDETKRDQAGKGHQEGDLGGNWEGEIDLEEEALGESSQELKSSDLGLPEAELNRKKGPTIEAAELQRKKGPKLDEQEQERKKRDFEDKIDDEAKRVSYTDFDQQQERKKAKSLELDYGEFNRKKGPQLAEQEGPGKVDGRLDEFDDPARKKRATIDELEPGAKDVTGHEFASPELDRKKGVNLEEAPDLDRKKGPQLSETDLKNKKHDLDLPEGDPNKVKDVDLNYNDFQKKKKQVSIDELDYGRKKGPSGFSEQEGKKRDSLGDFEEQDSASGEDLNLPGFEPNRKPAPKFDEREHNRKRGPELDEQLKATDFGDALEGEEKLRGFEDHETIEEEDDNEHEEEILDLGGDDKAKGRGEETITLDSGEQSGETLQLDQEDNTIQDSGIDQTGDAKASNIRIDQSGDAQDSDGVSLENTQDTQDKEDKKEDHFLWIRAIPEQIIDVSIDQVLLAAQRSSPTQIWAMCAALEAKLGVQLSLLKMDFSTNNLVEVASQHRRSEVAIGGQSWNDYFLANYGSWSEMRDQTWSDNTLSFAYLHNGEFVGVCVISHDPTRIEQSKVEFIARCFKGHVVQIEHFQSSDSQDNDENSNDQQQTKGVFGKLWKRFRGAA